MLSAGGDSHVSGSLKEGKTDSYVLQLEGLRSLSALKYIKPLRRLTHTGQWLDEQQLGQTEPEGDKAMLVAWPRLPNGWEKRKGKKSHKTANTCVL